MNKSILTIDTPNTCIDCPCHFAGESGMVICGVEKRELLSDDIETYKAEWCPLKEQKADRGDWIPCSERLPEIEQTVLLSLRSLDVSVGFRANTDGYFYTEGEGYVLYENVLAWQPLPEAYHG